MFFIKYFRFSLYTALYETKRLQALTLPAVVEFISRKEKGPDKRGLKTGAGEEGRTPDLMLGKHTL